MRYIAPILVALATACAVNHTPQESEQVIAEESSPGDISPQSALTQHYSANQLSISTSWLQLRDSIDSRYGADPDYALSLPLGTREIIVSTVEELSLAIKSALPGDAIVLRAGEYVFDTDDDIPFWPRPTNIWHWPPNVHGTEEHPIYLIAEQPRKTVFKGGSQWRFHGDHIIISGIHFMETVGDVRLMGDHQKLLGNFFDHPRAGVGIYSSDVEIAHNIWIGTDGALSIWLAQPDIYCDNDCTFIKRPHIHHNTFRDIPLVKQNGGEAIMLGYGYAPHPQGYDDSVEGLIEYNLFQRAQGDSEVISVKSDRNTIRYNCFDDNGTGTLTVRMGNDNHIYANEFYRLHNSAIRISGGRNIFENNIASSESGAHPAVDLHNGWARTEAMANNDFGYLSYIHAHNNLVRGNEFDNFRYIARDMSFREEFIAYSESNTIDNNIFFLSTTGRFKLEADRNAYNFVRSLLLSNNAFSSERLLLGHVRCTDLVYPD